MSEQFPTPQELEPLGGQVDYVPQDERFGPLSARPDGKLANAHTFLRNVNDNMALSATWQSADWLHEQLMPSEDGFNPFDDERVKAGKVKGRYFDAIAGTRSKAQMDHLLSRIDTNETMRARLEEEGGAWSALVAGVLDPTNAIGGPAMMGRGLLVGAFRGAAMGGAQTGFGEVVGPALDPTRDFQLENIVNGALIGGALGGVAGTIGSKTVTKWAEALTRDQRQMDAALNPSTVPAGAGLTPPGPAASATRFEVNATMPGFEPGLAPALGTEKLATVGGALNPLYNPIAWLMAQPHRVLNEIGQALGSDYGLMTKQHLKGEAPGLVPAFLRSNIWHGMVGQAEADFLRAYAKYIGKEHPAEPFGMNLTVMARRSADAVRGLIGRDAPDGKLSYDEFKNAATAAVRPDRIEAGPLSDPAAKEAVEAAARDHVLPLFQKANKALGETGVLRTQENISKLYEGRKTRYAEKKARLDELKGLETPTAAEKAEQVLLAEHVDELDEQLKRMEKGGARGPTVETEGMVFRDPRQPGTEEQLPVGKPANENGDPAPPLPVTSEIKPLTTDEPAFNPPANESGITVDLAPGRVYDAMPEAPRPDALEVELLKRTPEYAHYGDKAKAAIDAAYQQGAWTPELRDQLADDVSVQLPDDLETLDVQTLMDVSSIQFQLNQGKVTPELMEQAKLSPEFEAYKKTVDVADFLDEEDLLHTFVHETLPKADKAELLEALKIHVASMIEWAVMGALRSGRQVVVDLPTYQTGKPLVADTFHGTKKVFTEFDLNRNGGAGGGDTKDVIYSSRNPETTHDYSMRHPVSAMPGAPDYQLSISEELYNKAVDHPDFHTWVSKNFDVQAEAQMHPDELVELFAKEKLLSGPVAFAKDLFNKTAEALETKFGPTLDKLTGKVKQTVTGEAPAPNTVMSRVRMENPLVHDNVEAHGWNPGRNNRLIAEAKAAGHDGVVILNTVDGGPVDVIYIAFSPDQMRYRFDPEDFAAKQRVSEFVQGKKAEGNLHGSMPPPANDDIVGLSPKAAAADEVLKLTPANHNVEPRELDPNYVPRVFNSDKVLADFHGPRKFYGILKQRYQEKHGIDLSEEAYEGIVQKIVLGRQSEGDNHWDIGSARELGRKLPVENEDVLEFLETDIWALARTYFNRMAPTIEMHRMFGSRDAGDAIHDSLIQVIRETTEGTPEEILAKVELARKNIVYARDAVLGDLLKDTPLTATRVGVETLKNYGSITQMGKVFYAQVAEMMRPVMALGLMRNIQFALDGPIGNLKGYKIAQRELSLSGEGWDVAQGITSSRYFESGGVNGSGSRFAHGLKEATEPFNRFVRGPWYVMNLMGQVTDLTKNYTQVMVSHYLIEDMGRLVAGRLSKKAAARLAAVNIDETYAKAVLAHTDKSGSLHIPNLGAWPNEDHAARFLAAVAGETRRIIPTAGPGTKSPLSQGLLSLDSRRQHVLVTLPFQYKTYGIAATQKVLVSALQGRDANALGGVIAVVGAAYFGNYLKTPDKIWKRKSLEEKMFDAVDRSGLLGSLADVNNIIETGSRGGFGARPMLGLPPQFGKDPDDYDVAGLVAGPAGSKILDAYRVFGDDSLTDRQRASIVRRSIPMNNLLYWDWLLREGQEALGY